MSAMMERDAPAAWINLIPTAARKNVLPAGKRTVAAKAIDPNPTIN